MRGAIGALVSLLLVAGDRPMVPFFQSCALWIVVVAVSFCAATGVARGQSFSESATAGEEGGAILAVPAESPSSRVPGSSIDRQSVDAYEVRATSDNQILGRLRVLDPYTGIVREVRETDVMIIQEGTVVSRSRSGAEGIVEFDDVPEGESSVVAVGPDGMAAFGFSVLPSLAGGADAEISKGEQYQFDVLLVPGFDVTVAQHSICVGDDPILVPEPSRFEMAGPLAFRPVLFAGGAGGAEEPSHVRLASFDGGSGTVILGEDVSPRATGMAPLKGQPILIREGETGRGQLIIPGDKSGAPMGLANADVSFIRSGQIVEHVQTDENGYCRVSGLDDGVYSMVGVGDNGFIALGVRVATTPAATPTRISVAGSEVAELVSTTPYGGSCCGWEVGGAQTSALAYAPGFTCGGCGQVGCCGACGVGPAGGPCGPVAGGPEWGCCGMGSYGGFGGGYGGFGGGGGGLGGGGLAGALVGAGLGAAIGAAVAAGNDDDDPGDPGDPSDPARPVRPRPASPFLPPK